MALAASLSANADCELRIFDATLQDINRALETGCTTSEGLVARYVARTEAFEPVINGVITVNGTALDRARQLDAERRLQGPRGPLHGIPVLVKDNVNTADIVTTVGTVVLRNSLPPRDATIVTRLREAGAVVVAKTNLSELAQSHGRLGYSAQGGLTRNPYDLTRDASGSSTGSAAALAAGFGTLAIGTDTAGSVRGPASTAALVGLRPNLGLVSRAGIAPAAHTLDTAGPMARTVYGIAAMLGVMAGPDEADPRTGESATHARKDYTRFLDPNALTGARIGVARDFMGGNPQVDALAAIVFPTLACPPAPLPGEAPGSYVCQVDDIHNAGYLRVASVTGFPDISVPAGRTRAGLPVGLSFLGLPYSEPTLLGLAFGFEQRTRARSAPPSTPPLER